MELTPEVIRKLTNEFVSFTKKIIDSPSQLQDVAVVLTRHDDGWSLEAIQKPFNRQKYVTVIDLPPDIVNYDNMQDALIDLAMAISQKLTSSARIININLRRSPEQRRASSLKAVEARKKKHSPLDS